jgi:hypothetical protein
MKLAPNSIMKFTNKLNCRENARIRKHQHIKYNKHHIKKDKIEKQISNQNKK